MNNLGWIDKQILLVKENIQYHKDLLDESEEEYVDEIISTIKLLEPELQTLQQIKTELEAWEVVKHSIYKRKMGEERFIQVMGGIYNEGECWTSGINPYEILKKALEVEDVINM